MTIILSFYICTVIDSFCFSQPMRYKPSLSYAHRAGRPRPYGTVEASPYYFLL